MILGMADEHNLIGVSTMMLSSSLDVIGIVSELQFARAEAEVSMRSRKWLRFDVSLFMIGYFYGDGKPGNLTQMKCLSYNRAKN